MNKTESISELAKALNLFQSKMQAVKKDAVNPFFKSHYATLDAIWDAIRKPLTDNGLSVLQTLNTDDETGNTLDTTLLHTSGEWVSGSLRLNPVKDDPQALGSAISYARRYSLCALLGIVADEDDDANVATKPEVAKPKVVEKPKPPKKFDTTTTEGALEFLEYHHPQKWGHVVVAARLMDKYGVSGDTMKELIALLSPEQKAELDTIISSELAKANEEKK